ncbi:uncharacterized protein N7496_000527 [Penicillium cataractarum]|uniref:Uncharacterized protein n=1 Tax=Penicillium cataractarum TaxID=2100454 RepID=A0A9W9VUM4_9EURO|nr:uncharacterized protein N7496_000527 [Penicillium cataractarum]KAJ5389459.1 hypothetical protein N7496_000527 [Penicillium cataractarum]
MSSSIAMSSVAMARPGTTRPALSQLVATNTSRSRNTWHSARNYHSIRDKMERIARSIDKYQRHPQANLRRKTEACNGWPATAHRDPSSSKGWATHWPRSRFSELAGRDKTYWDAELEQVNHRIAHLKRRLDRDPYEALFGRRVESSHYIDQSDTATAWPGFLRTFLGAEKPMTDHPSKGHLQDFNFAQSPAQSSTSSSRECLEYDPISGRMAPKAPKPEPTSESAMQNSNSGVDCPPGSEVEAKFASNAPIVEDGQFQPGSASTAKVDTLKSQTMDCPPGGELEAKFASELNLASQSKEASPVDYIPDSELEARIVAETTRAQMSDLTVDCAPGSELEALFASNPAAVQAKHYPSTTTADTNVKKDGITVDCEPGNELEAKFLSDAASAETRGESEDLNTLHASDIRARYTPLESESDTSIKSSAPKDIKFDSFEDRVGDFLQRQNAPATSQWSQSDYRILAYDTTTSTVTTTESNSFFGTSETVQPHEILTRLHNPAKFVPFFAQMQADGYEIATGGGDILVFKRSVKNAKRNPVSTASQQQESVSPDVQADIAQYMRDDSYDSHRYVRHYDPSSTIKPSTFGDTASSDNFNSDPGSSSAITPTSSTTTKSKSKSKSTFRKVIRRMVLTGTITAGSCYAIGVVTEYFRTGGLDGRGADGFTPFESDRRHRE